MNNMRFADSLIEIYFNRKNVFELFLYHHSHRLEFEFLNKSGIYVANDFLKYMFVYNTLVSRILYYILLSYEYAGNGRGHT